MHPDFNTEDRRALETTIERLIFDQLHTEGHVLPVNLGELARDVVHEAVASLRPDLAPPSARHVRYHALVDRYQALPESLEERPCRFLVLLQQTGPADPPYYELRTFDTLQAVHDFWSNRLDLAEHVLLRVRDLDLQRDIPWQLRLDIPELANTPPVNADEAPFKAA